MTTSASCGWCGRSFTPRRLGSSTQKFCCRSCRYDLHTAARRWGIAALDAGLLTVEDLRNGPSVPCTAGGGNSKGSVALSPHETGISTSTAAYTVTTGDPSLNSEVEAGE